MLNETAAYKHTAFVSYSHLDRMWGEWLQRSIETYAIPKDLVGKTTPKGVVPRTLRPVFRDRWDLSAGHSIDEQINAALNQSWHLIVICSPNSTQSAYVNEEIFRFKAKGWGNRILALIVGGRPNDPERECFPEALRFDRVDGGALAPTLHTPIAADARPEGDDRELAKLKIIAGMLGLPLDEIRKREEIERRKRVRQARLVAGGLGALALVAIACFGAALWAYSLAEERRVEAVKRYEQALDSTIKFVTAAATFRTLLAPEHERKTAFWREEREGKLGDRDWRNFMREGRDPEGILFRLVRILADYKRTLLPAMKRFEQRLDEAEMRQQWVRHAERVAHNLMNIYGKKPEYQAELQKIKSEIVALGATPAPECLATAATAPPNDARSLDQLAQGAVPVGAEEACQ